MKFLFTLLSIGGFLACNHTKLEVPYGVLEQHAGYVPARIAVIPCQAWPAPARFTSLPMTNVSSETLSELCASIDQFVVDGFSDQPYMRGFSQKWVLRFLEEAGKPAFLSQIEEMWQHQASDCLQCKTPTAFYLQSIANRDQWRLWLNELSALVRNADAVLIPFVNYAAELRYPDRGLEVAKRAVGVTMLLVDTNLSYLLWSGGREAFATNQALLSKAQEKGLEWPAWSLVLERVLVEDLWKEFPGRQVYK